MVEVKREDNGIEGRFLAYEDGAFAGEMTYLWVDDKEILVEHTRVGEEFRGRGIAKILFDEMICFAKENNVKVMPVCSYVVKMFRKDPSLEVLKVSEE